MLPSPPKGNVGGVVSEPSLMKLPLFLIAYRLDSLSLPVAEMLIAMVPA